MTNTAFAHSSRSFPQNALRSPDLALRDAGRKARLTGVSSGTPMDDLLQLLPQAMNRRLRFHEPTATEPSFDELWLANLFDAIKQGDADRYRFGLLSRMSREQAACVHFAICKAAHYLDSAVE